jgi:hypothetical protein
MAHTFKAGDRVIRVHVPGSLGTVKEIREETVQSGDSREKDRPVIIGVQWDNGTMSFFGSAGLKLVQS